MSRLHQAVGENLRMNDVEMNFASSSSVLTKVLVQQLGGLTDLYLSAITWDWLFFPFFPVRKHARSLFGSVLLFAPTWLLLQVVTCLLRLQAQQHVQAGQLHSDHHLFLKTEREKRFDAAGPPPSFQSVVCTAPVPGLQASAFDPVSWAWLSSMGHHARALGLNSPQAPQGRKPDLKERSEKHSNPLLLWEGRQTAYQRAYQALVGDVDSQASEDWHLN